MKANEAPENNKTRKAPAHDGRWIDSCASNHNKTFTISKGWVARCKWPCPQELYVYRGEEKPVRCGSHVEDVKEDFYWDFQHEICPLPPEMFPNLKWEDEPIPVDIKITLK